MTNSSPFSGRNCWPGNPADPPPYTAPCSGLLPVRKSYWLCLRAYSSIDRDWAAVAKCTTWETTWRCKKTFSGHYWNEPSTLRRAKFSTGLRPKLKEPDSATGSEIRFVSLAQNTYWSGSE